MNACDKMFSGLMVRLLLVFIAAVVAPSTRTLLADRDLRRRRARLSAHRLVAARSALRRPLGSRRSRPFCRQRLPVATSTYRSCELRRSVRFSCLIFRLHLECL
ncbi:hypothetical protein EVAR_40967_1 [Eumeta japonica]|uniref:Uncharacterized protein n=1 Tax=Eumeta variegata TaxID=151549 RepID=A0A4C1X812_EUMVA|nr:hypothetical protein EVAR_40967_1 [Eumeta japonica]